VSIKDDYIDHIRSMDLTASEMIIYIERNGKFLCQANQKSILDTILLRGDPSCLYENEDHTEVNVDLDKIKDMGLLRQIYGIVALRVDRLKNGIISTSRIRNTYLNV